MHKQKQTLTLISVHGAEGGRIVTLLQLLQHVKNITQNGMYLFSYVYIYLSRVYVNPDINDVVPWLGNNFFWKTYV